MSSNLVFGCPLITRDDKRFGPFFEQAAVCECVEMALEPVMSAWVGPVTVVVRRAAGQIASGRAYRRVAGPERMIRAEQGMALAGPRKCLRVLCDV